MGKNEILTGVGYLGIFFQGDKCYLYHKKILFLIKLCAWVGGKEEELQIL